MEHHRGHRSVIYEGDVGDAVEWRQIKLHTFYDVLAATTNAPQPYLNVSRSISAPAVVSSRDQKNSPRR